MSEVLEERTGKSQTIAGSLPSNIVNAMSYAAIDPISSLMHARRSAEKICSHVLTGDVDELVNVRFDKLIELLTSEGTLPENIDAKLRLIQQCCQEYAARPTNAKPLEKAHIDPCLLALVAVTNWYFSEYLGITIPTAVVEANNSFEPISELLPVSNIMVYDQEALAHELGLPHPLRPYQWEGISFLVRSSSALVADEMGLGKTVQAIVALRILFRDSVSKRALVITPNALLYNWQHEFEAWGPDLVVRRLDGSSKDRLVTYGLPIQILIASYEQIRADALDIDPDIHFDAVILDEAQRIKNRNSRTALACRFLRTSRAWALTGTPLENSLEDLVSLFIFMSPNLVDIGMGPTEVHKRIQPYFLRRRKKDVLSEIPPIIIQDVTLELTGAQEAAYNDLWLSRHLMARPDGALASHVTLFALITKLKQLCNYDPASEESIKLKALSVLLDGCSEPDDKIIVFSQYVRTLDFISRSLGSFPRDMYTGKQSKEEKERILKNFKRKPGPRLLLMSLKAGGVGLNIQEASTVVLFDRWWNPAVENQAIQRAHRFGRERPLHVIRFLVADSIEERIVGILRNKQADFDAYVENATNAKIRLITRDELRRILDLPETSTS